MSKKALFSMVFGAALALSGGLAASGSEHSHKGHDHSKHEGHSVSEKSSSDVTGEKLAKVVRQFVTVDSKAKGGYFLVWDSKQGEALALDLKKVHESDPHVLKTDKKWFVCADFEGTNGKKYDLDFFIKKNKKGKFKITDVVAVHKEDGKSRYKWTQKDGKYTKASK